MGIQYSVTPKHPACILTDAEYPARIYLLVEYHHCWGFANCHQRIEVKIKLFTKKETVSNLTMFEPLKEVERFIRKLDCFFTKHRAPSVVRLCRLITDKESSYWSSSYITAPSCANSRTLIPSTTEY